jgi:acyl phosphate:glycerol-3-phosphate acyltransferase
VNEASPFTLATLTILAYLIGGLPFGYWFVRLRLGKDIRTIGSGNIGATNVHRAAGTKAGLIVLALDICKGWLAVYLVSRVTHGDPIALALAAFAVVVGHCYPIFLGFRGGKAVACFIGAFGFLAPLALLATAIVFVVVVVSSKFVSLGSIVGALTFPVLYWTIDHPPHVLLVSSVLAGVLIVYRHRANIARLRSGTENTFSLRRKEA